MSEKNYPEDGYNDLLSALASKPNKPQWLNTFVRTLQSRDVTLETWNSLINTISNIASDNISISDFLQILYKNCVWSVKGSASLEEKIGNVVLELSDFGINIDVSKINRIVYADGNTIYDKDGNILKLSNVNLAANSVDTDIIASGAVTLSKLNSDVLNKFSQIETEIDTKLTAITDVSTYPKAYIKAPDGSQTYMNITSSSSVQGSNIMSRDTNGRSQIADPDPNSDTDIANVKFVKEQVADMVNSAPETLDTLQELAAALGNDPNFATTIATELGKKAVKTEVDTALETKLDKSSVAQTTGQSTTVVMSQKATADAINSAINSAITTTLNTEV